MPCIRPLKGYKAEDGGITFNIKKSKFGEHLEVPCGQCWQCRLEHSRQWAIRMVHELANHNEACFITLTYNNENLPKNNTLVKKDFQNFMKRLRKKYSNRRISYYHCGEYGQVCNNCGDSYPLHQNYHKNYNGCKHWSPSLGRPHYHAILYGIDFNHDIQPWKQSKAGATIYKSKTLDQIWKKGFTSIGDVTFESCAYVARYVTKKITGEKALSHYEKPISIDKDTGEIKSALWLQPEYATMSRNPAIGKIHYEQYQSDIYPHDRVVQLRNGKSHVSKPPRYYDKLLEKDNEQMFNIIKERRIIKALAKAEENTEARLLDRANYKAAQIKSLERNFEKYHELS